MSKKRDDSLYIQDILESIKAIEEYIENIDYNQFIENRMIYSATIRELEIIGEATGKISQETKEKYPNIDYRTIKDFRNVLAHEYFGVDMQIVWQIVTQKLSDLKEQILKIK
jgi:uncharacterized protein with HEPN domain